MEKSSEFKKVRYKKEFGAYLYKKLEGGELDAPIYELYDTEGNYINAFGSYSDMKYYIETGVILG